MSEHIMGRWTWSRGRWEDQGQVMNDECWDEGGLHWRSSDGALIPYLLARGAY
ncbi:hypothetical protein BDZ85DRAFT_241131 [Elsinoe ampelina]|uniref:Uncharacterized protein n=1 Tax=Elsinoe ampelina TaxID=302913 RepID=A0A6A6G3Y5_9PEZI|nr:hypothetical protein BDZ85DRAFT_241131 [Elsinoe ampelina]